MLENLVLNNAMVHKIVFINGQIRTYFNGIKYKSGDTVIFILDLKSGIIKIDVNNAQSSYQIDEIEMMNYMEYRFAMFQ